MTENNPLHENARTLWELSVRVGHTAHLQTMLLARDKTKNASRIAHAAQSLLMSRQLNMLLRLVGGLEGFSPQVLVSNRSKQIDVSPRSTLQNVKRELGDLKRKKPKEDTTTLGMFFYLKGLATLDEAIELCNASLNDKTLMTESLLDKNYRKTEVSVAGLQEKYQVACASEANAYLMSFVDHLLISAKAIVEPPAELLPDEEPKPLSRWAEMEEVEDVATRAYTCGEVDIAAVWNSVAREVSERSRPIESTLYALNLMELASEIGNKLAE